MRLNNLKIYCQTEEDQSNVFDFLFCEYQNDIKYCTWEPDGDDENPGTWGMFIDDFPPELWDKMVNYLESEDSWVLEETVEMSLDDDDNDIYKEYYPWFFGSVAESVDAPDLKSVERKVRGGSSPPTPIP